MSTHAPDKLPERKRFKIVERVESFSYAFRGISIFLKSTHNAWIHVIVLVCVVLLGFYFHITESEWLALVFACGFVFVAEAFNTAIEIDIDLTSLEFHPYARDTKDVASGAVLIAVFTAVIVGLIIFVPYIFKLL